MHPAEQEIDLLIIEFFSERVVDLAPQINLEESEDGR